MKVIIKIVLAVEVIIGLSCLQVNKDFASRENCCQSVVISSSGPGRFIHHLTLLSNYHLFANISNEFLL
jgi:hypothetical protein